ncbi:MAG: GGDEF domain-containing protein, partial [Acetobacteraceae bacterium]|nr:GGDEF domain-containing protein [Acetobacteraceae bacterium]
MSAALGASWAAMGWDDSVFMVVRMVTGVLCAVAAGVAARLAAAPEAHTGRRLGAAAATVLLALIGGLAIVAGLREGIVQAGRPVPLDEWLWLPVDLAVPLMALALLRETRRRDALMAALAHGARHDPLTGLANRRGFGEACHAAMARAAREGRPATAVLMDIDRFKAINDGWGHAAGDAVLRDVARALSGALRPGDALGRVGGEEFALLVPGLSPAEALPLVERLRAAVADAAAHPAG